MADFLNDHLEHVKRILQGFLVGACHQHGSLLCLWCVFSARILLFYQQRCILITIAFPSQQWKGLIQLCQPNLDTNSVLSVHCFCKRYNFFSHCQVVIVPLLAFSPKKTVTAWFTQFCWQGAWPFVRFFLITIRNVLHCRSNFIRRSQLQFRRRRLVWGRWADRIAMCFAHQINSNA